jgi:hypothetical protein
LRKVFLRPEVLQVLLKHALLLCDESDVSGRTKKIKEITVKLLCIVCTVKTNRFYIPGETNMVERLRKESFDKGLFAALTTIYQHLDKNGTFNDLKQYIREKVLNLIELGDLIYHA